MSDQHEIQQLREEIRQLHEKLEDVSRRLEQVATPAPQPPPLPVSPVARQAPRPPETPPLIAAPPPLSIPPQESFEVRLGTVWLPRIGMALLLTGMAFFAAYYFPRLTASQKVALSYACCGVLCVLGRWLEKRMTYLARVLFAGGLALAYFVTYAAHHVPALRVIQSPPLAIALLSVVVCVIIVIAQARQSALLAGMALFFGYYTTIISDVAPFTLAANAVLALAAMFFLWRNRWVHISYLAVLATYLAYMLWVWQLNRHMDLGRLLFDRDYLSAGDFRLRAAFLALYWVVFAVGGLLARRDALELPERKGLLTLNNAFFFILFALLMQHAYSSRQWVFLFSFGSLLLITAAVAHQRFAPDRGPMDLLFLQGIIIVTLGVMDYFKGVQLVAALAVESLLLLWLARAVQSRGVAWVGRAAYLFAFLVTLDKLPGGDNRMIWAGWFASAVGLIAARVEGCGSVSAQFFSALATILAMFVANNQFSPAALRWVWLAEAILIAGLGGLLRIREIVWAAHLPVAWAFLKFMGTAADDRFWPLDPSLGLIAVLLGFGLVAWGRERTQETEDRPVSERSILLPYGIAAMIVAVMTTVEYCPVHWRLTAFAMETALLAGAGIVVRERTFFWLGVAAGVAGLLKYLGDYRGEFDSRYYAWVNLACSLWILGGVENLIEWRGHRLRLSETALRWTGAGLIGLMTAEAVFATYHLVDPSSLSLGWAVCGFAFLIVGFATKERPYRIGGLVALGGALLRVLFYDLRQMSTPHRILSFIVLGVILLVLAYLYAKNRENLARWL